MCHTHTHYSKHICRVVYYFLVSSSASFSFSSFFVSLSHSAFNAPFPHLFLFRYSTLLFFSSFLFPHFNIQNQSFCVDNVRATFHFGLFCVRSTTRKPFRPLLPIASIPPNGQQFISLSLSLFLPHTFYSTPTNYNANHH